MRLSERDKAIIRDINRFRVMDRDSIAELHFADKKRPINSANNVLKRLVAEGHIRRSTAWGTPYLYLSAESGVKANSAKIPHYLAILETYKEICAFGKPEIFVVEPKYAKGLAEPDAFFIWRRTPFFLECQRTFYSQKQVDSKFKRYKALYDSGLVFAEPWQPADRKVFPYILVLSESRWSVNGEFPFKVVQAQSFRQFVESLRPTQPKPSGLVVDLRK
jgi:hypothetical protein